MGHKIWDRMIGGSGQNVIGTAHADGDLILTFNLAAGKKLAIMSLNCFSNAALTVFELLTGTIAAPTILMSVSQENADGGVNLNKEDTPLLVIDNSAGGTVLAVILRMPQKHANVANNPVTTYADGSVWGYEF